MFIINGAVTLDKMGGCSPSLATYSSYTDTTGTRISIPNSVVVSLYELLKHEAKKNKVSFKDFVDSLYPMKEDK